MKKILYSLFMYCYYTLSITASTTSLPVDISISHHTIGEYTSIYEDTNASMLLVDIMKLPNTAFSPLNKSVSSHGFTHSAMWYRFDVINNKKSTLTKLLVFEPAWLDKIDITVISPQGNMLTYQGGNTYNYSKRAIEHYLINFKPTFEVGKSQVYIRIQTRDPFIVSIALIDEKIFLSEQPFYALIIGLFYGGMIALLIYNLLLYFGIKKHYYLFYVLYLLSFLILNAAYNGYTFMFIFSEHSNLQNWSHSLFAYVFALATLLFATSFLNLKEHHNRLFKLSTYLIYSIVILSILSALLGGYHYHVIFGIISIIIASSYVAIIALYSLQKGNRSARYYLLATISGLLGILVTALTLMSIIPYNYFTYKASEFGMYIDIILLSLALADRLKIAQEEKLKAEIDATTDVLTGMLNRRAFYEISEDESAKLSTHYKDFSVLMIDIDNLKTVNDNYGHPIGDELLKEVSQCITVNIKDSNHNFRLGGDEFLLFIYDMPEEEAYQLAERIRKDIENIHLTQNNHDLPISCSIGISTLKDNSQNIDIIVKQADRALYEVKHSGKNSVKVWQS